MALTLACLCLSTGCGYYSGGTWEDDPANYRRAFGRRPAEGIEVRHSLLHRLPRSFRKKIFFFELEADERYVQALVAANDLTEIDPAGQMVNGGWLPPFEVTDWACGSTPEWFAPGEATNYRLWLTANSFVLFNESTKTVWFHACHL